MHDVNLLRGSYESDNRSDRYANRRRLVRVRLLEMRQLSKQEDSACAASCSFAASDLKISSPVRQGLRLPMQSRLGEMQVFKMRHVIHPSIAVPTNADR